MEQQANNALDRRDHNEQATVLLVDDDPILLESLADVIRKAGYKSIMAANGVKALQAMQYHKPDSVVSDIAMPEMDGYQFYEAVRRNPAWLSIPFIFLSAKGEEKDLRRGYQLGADHYITKPFEPEDLVVAVENRLRRVEEIQSAVYEEVEATKKQLMTVFGHELRTPLGYIYGYVHLLEEGYGSMSDEVIGKMLHSMSLGTERLVRLIEDLILLVSIDSGLAGEEIERFGEHVDLSRTIEHAVRDLQPKSEERNITVSMALPKDLLVFGIATYIRSIFERLIDNGIKFGKPGGHVWARLEAEGDCIVVSVRDDGIGIPTENQKHIFDQLYQVDREKQEQQGAGLGLAIVERLVQLHGGAISVASVPGRGSEFTIRLPRVQLPETDPDCQSAIV